MRVLVMLVFAGLAGCVQDAAPADDAELPPPAYQDLVRNATYAVVASGDTECYAAVCIIGGPERMSLPVLLHERIGSVVLDVQPREVLPWEERAVTVELRCGSDWVGCPAAPLAKTHGVAPLRLEVQQVGAWGGDVEVVVRMDGHAANPTEDQYLQVRAGLFLQADPDRRHLLEERSLPIDIDGATGFCVFVVEPSCTSFPSGYHALGAFPEGTRRIDANVTWDPLTPSAEELEVELQCLREESSRRPCEDRPPLTWSGPSPLRIEGDLTDFPPGAALRLVVSMPFEGLRQEFHVDGELVYLADARERDADLRDP